MGEYYKKICSTTFSVHHNPNCPSPFQVRLIGKGQALLDNLHPSKSHDVCGHGKTLEKAAKDAWRIRYGG